MFERRLLILRLLKMETGCKVHPATSHTSVKTRPRRHCCSERPMSGVSRFLQKVISAALAGLVLLITPVNVLARPGGGGHSGGGGGHYASGGAHLGGGWGGRGSYGWGGYRGYGWSGYRGWGYGGWDWGYPYGYGLGLGVGLGLGCGLYGGYPYGYGYPAYGYYGYYGYAPDAAGYSGTYIAAPYASPPPPPVVEASAPIDDSPRQSAQEFADKGEAAFRAGDYPGAVYALRHAAVDDPQNPVVMLLLGQALFAAGQFNEAAGATQTAMRQLPKEKWGTVVSHYTELYGDARNYTRQLRALEKHVSARPNDPALRFLAGFHYAYLGFTAQAIDQLDKVLALTPRDDMARQLRDEMRGKQSKPAAAPEPPTPAIPAAPQGPALEP
jgi:hypothetical protein